MKGKDIPGPLFQKEYNELGKTVSLMLRMCRPIFVSDKAIVLDNVFCVAKGITDIKAKDIYATALIKKRHYWPKGVPSYLIDTNFENKDVGAVGLIEAKTEDNKLGNLFFKEPDYVIKLMASWMTLDDLVGARTRRDFIDRFGTKETKQFAYWQPFGVHFRYIHQVHDHNNRRHAPIYLERIWGTRFWPD